MRSINKAKIISALSITVVIAILIGIAWYSITTKINEIKAKWPAIQFAMEEPDIVLATRDDFASKSAQLKEGYFKKEPTAQEKALEELTKQLQSSK